jgi:hypothetical protein
MLLPLAAWPVVLTGFEHSVHFDEQTTSFVFKPGMLVHVNAPAADSLDPGKPTRIILYTLPNGNTTTQTIGKVLLPGDDWHYAIQHIGAQTRRLREVLGGENVIVAYLEAEKRSWPGWRQANAQTSSPRIVALVHGLRDLCGQLSPTVTLSAHSGGGSFVFGFINGVDRIPDWVDRIALLDANYAYDESERHGAKLAAWLRASARHHLCILAYDDRNIMLNGKLVLGPTGGTYRSTQRMMAGALGKEFALQGGAYRDFITTRGLDGRITVMVHTNPLNKILHTVLVEKNGFVLANLAGTDKADPAEDYYGDQPYRVWVQFEPEKADASSTAGKPGRSSPAPATLSEASRLARQYAARLRSTRYMEHDCEFTTWPGWDKFTLSRCRYSVHDRDGTTKTATVVMLNPSAEQLARWVATACVAAKGEAKPEWTERLFNHVIGQSGGQYPVAGIVYEDILPADGAYETYCFRDGVTVEVEGVPHRGTRQPSPGQIDSSLTGTVVRVFRYARVQSTTPEEYRHNGGTIEVGTNEKPQPAWLDVSRECYQRAWSSDWNDLMIAWARANL